MVLQKQEEPVEEIVFMMSGDFIVGYNNEHFLFINDASNVKNILDLQIKSKMEKKPKYQITKKITEFFGPRKTLSKRKKFHFPIAFKPGQNIGMFEMFYERKSSFLYKTGTLPDGEATPLKCFFIRKQSWRKIMNEADSNIKE